MGNVWYNLVNASPLGMMAPPALGGGGFGAAALPPGMGIPGLYIIVNTGTNNRYIGTAINVANRFQTRLETVTELGFSAAVMNQIDAFWGGAAVQNTAPGSPVVAAAGYAPGTLTPIDGAGVNLERLLIRFVLTQLGAGGTISNNMFAAPGANYANPTGNAITVTLNWGATPHFAPGGMAAVWPGVGAGW